MKLGYILFEIGQWVTLKVHVHVHLYIYKYIFPKCIIRLIHMEGETDRATTTSTATFGRGIIQIETFVVIGNVPAFEQ